MSLFRSIASKKRENHFKNEIIKELKDTIKEIQSSPPVSDQKLSTSTVTNALCTILEALFLHGLRETFLSKMVAMTTDMIKKPECNFWSIVLIFSHHEIISNINKLGWLTNDIGRCRAWIRLALNENELVAYMDTMSRDAKSLAQVYKNTAFLRDSDQMGIAIKLLEGILQYEFDLPVNSSFLNVWPDDPLLKSGIWSPAMKEELKGPVFEGVDLAHEIVKEEFNSSLGSSTIYSLQSTLEYSPRMKVDENALLKEILGSAAPSTSKTNNRTLATRSTDVVIFANNRTKYDSEDEGLNNEVKPNEPQSAVDTNNDRDTSSEAVAQCNDTDTENQTKHQDSSNKPTQSTVEHETKKPSVKPMSKLNKGDERTFRELVEDYRPPSQTPIDVDLDDLKSRIKAQVEAEAPPLPPTSSRLSPTPSSPIPDSYEGFEIVPSSQSPLDLPQFAYYTACLTQLTRERGLRTQNYSCHQCYVAIGMNFSHHCWFTGDYFCPDCFGKSTSVIPARILFNWDFIERPVCTQAALFLNDIFVHPVFNVKQLNPRLYLLIDKMTQIHYLRLKLNYIKAYLVSCKTTENYLHVELWPREYLYESLHTYSLFDLKQIHSGKLLTILNTIISYGVRHIAACHLCKLKGHLCELCRSSSGRSNTNSPDSASPSSSRSCDVIFPFDLERTHTCRVCHATYHKECWQGECPRCERIRRRRRGSGETNELEGSEGDLEGCSGNSSRVKKHNLEANSDGSSELKRTSDGQDLIECESNELHATFDVHQNCDGESQQITTDVRSHNTREDSNEPLLATDARQGSNSKVEKNEFSFAANVRDKTECEIVESPGMACEIVESPGMVKHWTGQYGQMLEKRRGLSVENIPDVDENSAIYSRNSLGDDANTMSNVRNKSSTSPLKLNYTGKSTISTVQDQSVTSPLKSNSTGKLTISTVQDNSVISPLKSNSTLTVGNHSQIMLSLGPK
uniref:Pleckstrin homology domain-containing family M member 3 n=1 Tax=Cacopsylla melanoneura TaxID=428564 RepID=A0A8D8MB89_9HEMI